MGRLTTTIGARLLQGLVVVWGVSTVCFLLTVGLPGDMALRVAMARYGEDLSSRETADYVARRAGLDRPLMVQYLRWIESTTALNLGRSLVSGRPVKDELRFHLGNTLKLGTAALALSLAAALPLGIMAGIRPGSGFDVASALVSCALVSIPGFVLGAVLIVGLAVKAKILPAAGFAAFENLILPATTLAAGLAAVSSRIIRTAVAEFRTSFFLTFAQLKGLPRTRIIYGHALRNAAPPVVTFLGVQAAHLFDGVVVVENLFDWPGLGKLILDGLLSRDLPVIQGTALLLGLIYVMVNLVTDLICLWLDPRQRQDGAAP